MKGLVFFRWLTPAALAALLSIPIQIASAHPSGGGGGMGGHGMGGMGGHGMGSMSGHGMGGRPSMSSHFLSRNAAIIFDLRAERGGADHLFARFTDGCTRFAARGDRFSDHGDRFRDRHEREGFEREGREFFFRHNFFV